MPRVVPGPLLRLARCSPRLLCSLLFHRTPPAPWLMPTCLRPKNISSCVCERACVPSPTLAAHAAKERARPWLACASVPSLRAEPAFSQPDGLLGSGRLRGVLKALDCVQLGQRLPREVGDRLAIASYLRVHAPSTEQQGEDAIARERWVRARVGREGRAEETAHHTPSTRVARARHHVPRDLDLDCRAQSRLPVRKQALVQPLATLQHASRTKREFACKQL